MQWNKIYASVMSTSFFGHLQNGHAYKDKWGLEQSQQFFWEKAHYKKFYYINFSKVVKSIVTLKNGSKIIK